MESLPNKYTMHSMTISNNEGVQEDIKQIFTRFSLTESIYANYIGCHCLIGLIIRSLD